MNVPSLERLTSIDLYRLSGINRMLGIEYRTDMVRIVELECFGATFNKYKRRYRVRHHATVQFDANSGLEQKAACLRDHLHSHQVTTRYAAATVPQNRVKSVRAEIPSGVTDIDAWIEEHHETLLKLPVGFQELSYGYEIFGRTGSSISVEITFVKKNTDVEELRAFCKAANLDLLALGAGLRDALNSIWCTGGKSIARFHYFSQGFVLMTSLEDGRVVDRELVYEDQYSEPEEGGAVMAGEIPQAYRRTDTAFSPFAISTEYTLAAGLALKGILPELSPVDLLSPGDRDAMSTGFSKKIVQRAILICGAIVFFLLVAQTGASMYLQRQSELLDEKVLNAGSLDMDVAALEGQVNTLEKETRGGTALSYRSNIARVIHVLAEVTPEKVWLSKLTLSNTEKQKSTIVLSGYAKSNEHVAEFLNALGRDMTFSDIQLIRSGFPVQGEQLTAIQSRLPHCVTFSISCIVK